MATYELETTGAEVAIAITGVADRQAELLQAFGECQEGRCSCPTDEYEKVETMEVSPSADRIDIRLRAKPGDHFDTDAITSCLDYTVGTRDES